MIITLVAEMDRGPLCLSIGPGPGWILAGAIPQHLSPAWNEQVDAVPTVFNHNLPLFVEPIAKVDGKGKTVSEPKRVVSA